MAKIVQSHVSYSVTQWPDAMIRSPHCTAAATIDSVLGLGLASVSTPLLMMFDIADALPLILERSGRRTEL